MTKPNKIIGIGFHKTGTSTLRAAFEILGYTVQGPRTDLADELFKENWSRVFNEAKPYDVLEDNPWAVIYKELDRAFPGSKFIMTVRDEEKWIKSVVNHFGGNNSRMREYIYGENNGNPEGKKDLYLKRYKRHQAEVKEYFKNRPNDLLIVSWEDGDGWEKICRFLQTPIPKKRFPHVNKGQYNLLQKVIGQLKDLIRPIIKPLRKNG